MNEYTLCPAKKEVLVSDLIRESALDITLPCGGNHTCGKCKIKASGDLSEVSAAERKMLSPAELESGVRLACFAKANGPITINVDDRSLCKIAVDGVGVLRASEPMMAAQCCGVAVDIGTTTVVCKLYNFQGEEIAVACELNAQKSYGADVISRINFGIHNGNDLLHNTIVAQIEKMFDVLAKKAKVSRENITHAVVTGNTTMLHFFSGIDPKGIGFAPFIAKSLFGGEYSRLLKDVTVYIPPCVSAYVGADLVCCILASKMRDKKETALIIDIGTNGEMALAEKGRILCCSTAAGPAFEGAGISDGMVATDGAISHLKLCPEKKDLTYETISDKEIKGICGSGILDAVAIFVEQGLITYSGRITNEAPSFLSKLVNDEESKITFAGTNVSITQEDIRQVQLAKAAILAGCRTLLEDNKCDCSRVEVLYLCGGFGSFLDPISAESIGLIPEGTAEKTLVLGNGAITGAAMLLLDKSNITVLDKIIKSCEYIELSGNDEFMEHYIESMSFGCDDEY